uniref:Transmembrane protein n=1 Tax=Medicago truncatula TaxID=3880 RepID=I3T6Z8_MEDTR|nr:unknown [Medicago truncatula]
MIEFCIFFQCWCKNSLSLHVPVHLEMTFNMGDSQPLHLHHIQNVFRTSLIFSTKTFNSLNKVLMKFRCPSKARLFGFVVFSYTTSLRIIVLHFLRFRFNFGIYEM